MSSILAGIRDLIVADGAVDDRVFRAEDSPQRPQLPYVTISDDGDHTAIAGDGGAMVARRRRLTAHLWQDTSNPDDILAGRIRAAVDGQRPSASDVAKPLRAYVGDLSRLSDPEPAIMHSVVTIEVAYIP